MHIFKLFGALCFLAATHLPAFSSHRPFRVSPPMMAIQDSIKTKFDTTVYMVVESPPEFPGGRSAMLDFIKRESKFRIATTKSKTSETVHLKLLIERNGTVSSALIAFSNGSKKFEDEAKRIAMAMPTWKPGYQSGQALRTYSIVFFNFK